MADNSAAIMHVVPHVFYKGAYLRTKSGERGGPFEVQVAVHLQSLGKADGTVTITGEWKTANAKQAAGQTLASAAAEGRFGGSDGETTAGRTPPLPPRPTASAKVSISAASGGKAVVHLMMHADEATLLWWLVKNTTSSAFVISRPLMGCPPHIRGHPYQYLLVPP